MFENDDDRLDREFYKELDREDIRDRKNGIDINRDLEKLSSKDYKMNIPSLTAIQDIANWISANCELPDDARRAVGLIESICRHDMPVWNEAEAEKYGIGK